MRVADEGFFAGRVAATTTNRDIRWGHWCRFVHSMGVDPYLEDIPFERGVRILTTFAGLVRAGVFGRGRRVQAATVSGYLTSIGQTICLAKNRNPTKVVGSDKLIPRISQMLDGFRKEDPPTLKKLPVEADVPEFMCKLGLMAGATALASAVGDLSLIVFYYLWRIGEYTIKGSRNNSKQTVQFRMKDMLFFRRDESGKLRQLSSRLASDEALLEACGCTFKLDNQKNGWKNVCVHHETNGDPLFCPVKAAARRFIHIRKHMKDDWDTLFSAYYDEKGRHDVTDKDISVGLKNAAASLNYPAEKGIPIERIDTHSLRSGGANALSLAGYSDRQIQKMGRWRGKTFMEYIREELATFSEGMSKDMSRRFGFVNIAGGLFHDITDEVIKTDYNVNVSI